MTPIRVGVMVALLAGCAAGKQDVDEDFSDLADLKADAFSYRLRMVGVLQGGASATTQYTKNPRFRGWWFVAGEGDEVDVRLTSKHGDPVTWVLDSRFRVVAKNDDADDTTYDSHLTARLPASEAGRYYIVFRDYDLERHYFTATLGLLTSPEDPTVERLRARYQIWVAEMDGIDNVPLLPADELPAGARRVYDDYQLRLPTWHIASRAMPFEGRTVFLVTGGDEEIFWADFFDEGGQHLSHGYSGDGCCEITYWDPTPWDPSICSCDAGTATPCNYCE